MLSDVKAYDAAKERLAKGEDEIIPLSIIEKRLSGENTLKIWRNFRKITQHKLAEESGVSRALIAAIESGNKKGSATTLKKLAASLNIAMKQLV